LLDSPAHRRESRWPEVAGKDSKYAANSPYDVFLVDGKYLCCYQGVWFVSTKATGPWTVCDSVPPAIYTIPPTSPKYNVTYVYVYNSTPETVTCGHTAGYQGQYVAYGLLMFGLGYAIADNNDDFNIYYGYSYYHTHWYSYGCAARYDYYHGGYYRAATVYGPYGGAGRYASYDPSTGIYRRGAYAEGPYGEARMQAAYDPYSGARARGAAVSGPGGSRAFAEGYNPSTGRYGAAAGGSNPYGSWGKAYVSDGDGWARGGYRSNERGTVAGAETSEGGKIVTGEGERGSGFVGKTSGGDVYAGKDGNAYRKTDDGWQKYENGSWTNPDRQRSTTTTRQAQPTAQKSTQSNSNWSQTRQQLEHDSQSRVRGSQQATRVQSQRSGSGGGRRR